MSSPFFPLADPNDPNQFNWDVLASLLPDTGGAQYKIRFGVANAVWSGGTGSAAVSVAHGMGSTPVAVALLPVPGGTAVLEAQWRVTTLNATNVIFDGTRTAATTSDTNVSWIALG